MVQVLSQAVEALVASVDAVRAQCPSDLPGPQALEDAVAVFAQLDTLRTVALRRLSDIDARGLHALDAAPSTSSWVEAQDVGLGRDDVALAKKLSRMPQVSDHVSAGTLPLACAVLVGQALDKVRRHVDRPDGRISGHDGERAVANVVVEGVLAQVAEVRGGFDDDDPALHELIDQLVEICSRPVSQLARLEAAFVLLARRVERQQLGQALDRLVDAVLPERLEDAAERGHQGRGLVLVRKPDGSGFTIRRGDLDLECGTYLQAVIAAARSTDPDNPLDTARWAAQRAADLPSPAPAGHGPAAALPAADRPGGDEPPAPGGAPREPVAEDLDGGLDGAAPDGREACPDAGADLGADATAPAPRSRAQQDHDALSLGLRRLLDSGVLGSRGKAAPHVLVTAGLDSLHGEPGALPARTGSGVSLPRSLVRRLLCDSRITRVVLGLGRRVLEVSHSERTLKAHERHALHVQWGGRCAGAGCTSPPGALVPHHANAWHRTGTTSYADTVPFCARTHHDLHEGGQVIRLRDGRYLGPDGWVPGPDG